MRSARILVCLLALTVGLAAAFLLVPRAVRSLRSLTFPTTTLPRPRTATVASDPPPRRRGSRTRPSLAAHSEVGATTAPSRPASRDRPLPLVELIGLELAGGIALITAVAGALVARRARRRRSRTYALYELHLSTHDQAKGQDLEDMVESIANIVRACTR